jgi:hypothetical protein
MINPQRIKCVCGIYSIYRKKERCIHSFGEKTERKIPLRRMGGHISNGSGWHV